jgi:hypothetical protein
VRFAVRPFGFASLFVVQFFEQREARTNSEAHE